MFDLIQHWPFRSSTNQPLRFRNRVFLNLEDLEMRSLLATGIAQAPPFVGPLPAAAAAPQPGSAPLVGAPIGPLPVGVPGSTGPAGPNAPRPAVNTTGPNALILAGNPAGPNALAPAINTTGNVVLPGVNAAAGLLPPVGGVLPLPSLTSVLPGQGTVGGTEVGGQNLLPGVVTTPPTPTPAQQIRAGILNTTDPYAAFQQTIMTKEGEKDAGGVTPGDQELLMPLPNRNPQKPARTSGAAQEQEEQQEEPDLPDSNAAGTDDQAALPRYQADAFFADGAVTREDQGWAPGNATALAGTMLILGGS